MLTIGWMCGQQAVTMPLLEKAGLTPGIADFFVSLTVNDS